MVTKWEKEPAPTSHLARERHSVLLGSVPLGSSALGVWVAIWVAHEVVADSALSVNMAVALLQCWLTVSGGDLLALSLATNVSEIDVRAPAIIQRPPETFGAELSSQHQQHAQATV